jgi:hypothetical protein
MRDIVRILDTDPKDWTERDRAIMASLEKDSIFSFEEESGPDLKSLKKQIKGLEETNEVLMEALKEVLTSLEHIHNSTKDGVAEIDFMIEDDIKLAKKAIKKAERRTVS